MIQEKNSMEIVYPFGPPVGQVSVPHEYVSIINEYAQNIAAMKNWRDYDHSERLVGAVTQELSFRSDGFTKHTKKNYEIILKYLDSSVKKYFSRTFMKQGILVGEKSEKFIEVRDWDIWIVRQYQHDYNPMHSHSKYSVSGVLYTKVPSILLCDQPYRKKGSRDGTIDFMYGGQNFLCEAKLSVRPQVGLMLLFPSHLIHTVYPFNGTNEERCCMAFNASLDFVL